ncbi:TetR/AcrR family transcriptional regulator [Anaerolentibacter hominis]|uniref:TetR/AcrR family transcriptional regulator n=1 Tax=Anaerolentibacter hominis TaxID=3079009 RepID=UPI0031B8341A
MGDKSSQTKEWIRQCALVLFAEKGFTAVTMKDICEASGLSRGGLYRHYGSTGQLFEEVLKEIVKPDDFIRKEMDQGTPAGEILESLLARMQQEMLEQKTSLSRGIYEYSSVCDSSFMLELNRKAKEKWRTLIEYGISRKEFAPVNPEQMSDLILYVYQGVRLWSRIIPLEPGTVTNIIEKIRGDLVRRQD